MTENPDQPAVTSGDQTESDDVDRPSVVFLNRDLFAGIGVVNTIRSLGYDPQRVTSLPEFIHLLRAREAAPVLGIVDMNGPIEWPVVAAMMAEPSCPPVIGFGPHVDIEGRKAAKAAGLTRVFSNGDFSREMAQSIQRYARKSN